MPRVLRPAIPARAIQLADVGGIEVLDGDQTPAVVLEDFVAGTAGTAAVDVGGSGGLAEGGGVLADVGPPDVVEGAGSFAVYALAVVGTDDDVGEGCAVLEDEDGVFFAAFGLVGAGRGGAVPLFHAAVEGLAGGDGADCGEVGCC